MTINCLPMAANAVSFWHVAHTAFRPFKSVTKSSSWIVARWSKWAPTRHTQIISQSFLPVALVVRYAGADRDHRASEYSQPGASPASRRRTHTPPSDRHHRRDSHRDHHQLGSDHRGHEILKKNGAYADLSRAVAMKVFLIKQKISFCELNIFCYRMTRACVVTSHWSVANMNE